MLSVIMPMTMALSIVLRAAIEIIYGPQGITLKTDLLPGEIPQGRQKQVEFALALMQKSRVIALDEPMAGKREGRKTTSAA